MVLSPDGNWLAFEGPIETARGPNGRDELVCAHVRVWDVARNQEAWTAGRNPSLLLGLAFALDGKTLASGDESGYIQVWDVPSGQPRHPLLDGPGHALAFRPD